MLWYIVSSTLTISAIFHRFHWLQKDPFYWQRLAVGNITIYQKKDLHKRKSVPNNLFTSNESRAYSINRVVSCRVFCYSSVLHYLFAVNQVMKRGGGWKFHRKNNTSQHISVPIWLSHGWLFIQGVSSSGAAGKLVLTLRNCYLLSQMTHCLLCKTIRSKA